MVFFCFTCEEITSSSRDKELSEDNFCIHWTRQRTIIELETNLHPSIFNYWSYVPAPYSYLCVCISFHHKDNWNITHLSFNYRERLKIQHVKEEGVNQCIDNTEHAEVTVHKASTSNRLDTLLLKIPPSL